MTDHRLPDPPPEIMEVGLELAHIKNGLHLCGRRFIFFRPERPSVILLGTVTGAQLSDEATLEIYVSTPYFHMWKLKSLIHGKKHEWYTSLASNNKRYKGILQILD